MNWSLGFVSEFELSASCLGLVRFEQQPLEDRGSERRSPFLLDPWRRHFLRPYSCGWMVNWGILSRGQDPGLLSYTPSGFALDLLPWSLNKSIAWGGDIERAQGSREAAKSLESAEP